MADDVRDSYNAMAEAYAAHVLGELDGPTAVTEMLAEFAQLVALDGGAGDRTVADLGCGPGHLMNHLSKLGLTMRGYDISPGQIAQAQGAFPDLDFQVGDLMALDIADASLAGIVSRHSLIHAPPTEHATAFGEWARILAPGAPVLVTFFAANSVERHGSPFDHAVVTAYELFPETVASGLLDAGFTDIEVSTRAPAADAVRKLDHGKVIARRASS